MASHSQARETAKAIKAFAGLPRREQVRRIERMGDGQRGLVSSLAALLSRVDQVQAASRDAGESRGESG